MFHKKTDFNKHHAAGAQYHGLKNKHRKFELNMYLEKWQRYSQITSKNMTDIHYLMYTVSKLLHTDFMASNGNKNVLYQVIASNYGFKQKDKRKIIVGAPTSTR